jgi:hypothetical protein
MRIMGSAPHEVGLSLSGNGELAYGQIPWAFPDRHAAVDTAGYVDDRPRRRRAGCDRRDPAAPAGSSDRGGSDHSRARRAKGEEINREPGKTLPGGSVRRHPNRAKGGWSNCQPGQAEFPGQTCRCPETRAARQARTSSAFCAGLSTPGAAAAAILLSRGAGIRSGQRPAVLPAAMVRSLPRSARPLVARTARARQATPINQAA